MLFQYNPHKWVFSGGGGGRRRDQYINITSDYEVTGRDSAGRTYANLTTLPRAADPCTDPEYQGFPGRI